MVRRIHLPVHCAPMERQTVIGREAINIWLLWSQSIALLPSINIRGLYVERNELPIDQVLHGDWFF